MTTATIHLVGGGIASLSSAWFLIEDAGIPAANIHILEQAEVTGGSLDGSGSPEEGYLIRGGRMFERRMVNLWEFLVGIPSTRRDSPYAAQSIRLDHHARDEMARGAGRRGDRRSAGGDGSMLPAIDRLGRAATLGR